MQEAIKYTNKIYDQSLLNSPRIICLLFIRIALEYFRSQYSSIEPMLSETVLYLKKKIAS